VSKLLPFYQQQFIEAGCDEAGRGCLAGPVVAAAVVLPPDFDHPLLNDSKKMTPAKRNLLAAIIKEQALAYAIAWASPNEIDTINILQASFLAMHRAIDQLKLKPALLLIDGNRFNPYPDIPHQCIVGGDGLYRSIAAASILAKTYRDELMVKLHLDFPHYCWDRNKGYPTTKHKQAIVQHGITSHHRKSFNMGIQLEIF
jgi:ribonuclease HII